MALPNPNNYPDTYGGAQRYAWDYYQAGGAAASVTKAGQTYRKSDTLPGGVLYMMFHGSGGSSGGGAGGAMAGSGYGSTWGPPGGGTGGAPGGGGLSAAGPVAAINAHQPAITGGGAGFSIGAVDNSVAMTAWPGEWEGVDTESPDTKMPESLSPEATNWNALEKFGARCVRRGVAKMLEDRSTLTISASPMHADYRAVSICPIADSEDVLMCFADNDGTIGGAIAVQPISLFTATQAILWGRPQDLRTFPGPKLTLTEPATGTIRVTYDYTNVWSTVALQKITCKSISIRYNIGSGDVTFPIDMDGVTDEAARRAGTAAKDRATWDGTSATVDIDLSTQSVGTVVYVSAWAHGLLGTSERSIAARART